MVNSLFGRRSGQGAARGPQRARPRVRRPVISPSTRRSLIMAAVIGVIIYVVFVTSAFWVNWWWFGSVGYRSIIVTRYASQFGAFFVFGVVAAAFFLANVILALRRTRAVLAATGGSTGSWIDRILVPLLFLAAAVIFVLAGSIGWSHWNELLLFLHASDFGVEDPVYGRDVGFYVFALPVLRLVRSGLTSLVLITAIAVAITYAVRLGVNPRYIRGVPRLMRTHVLALVGGLLLLIGASFWLANYELVYSERGFVFGASYTDINVQRWSNWILAILSVAVAVLLVSNAWVQRIRLLVAAVAGWAILAAVLGVFVPAVVQEAVVSPSQFRRESTSIANNIEMTRAAYDLDSVEARDLAGTGVPTTADVAANSTTLDNVRLWDYRVIQETYQRNAARAPYYIFPDVDVDRYQFGDQYQQVLLSARELDLDGLPENAQTWTNLHLTYTHGYGLVISPVNGVSRGGQPIYLVSAIPPEPFGGQAIDRPQIYFGESTDGWVILNTDEAEFDGLIGGESGATTPYSGAAAGSIGLGNTFNRLISAVYLRDRNVFLSGAVTGDSRLVIRRDIVDRVETIAPFFSYDPDPYLVVADGRLYWILDGYTSTDRYPNATRYDGINYLRNSVKVVVDAYDGTVTFYRTPTPDPIADAYAEIYDDLFTPISEVPPSIAAHFRYPERLFTLQAQAIASYHVTDPRNFYDGEERWGIAQEDVQGEVKQMEPYYVTLTLPGEQTPDFSLILPFTPSPRRTGQNTQNMTAWMAARTDGQGGPRLVVYRFPRELSVDGPRQVEARIDQDPDISSQITLWSQSGSEVIRGNLLVIPLESGNLYVQPLYLRATGSEAAFPELQRVIVASADQVAMEPTLDAALAAVLAPEDGTASTTEETQQPETTEPQPPPATDGSSPGTASLAQQALDAYQRAQVALQNGDWATYGQEQATVEAILEQLAGQAETPEASPGPEATPTS